MGNSDCLVVGDNGESIEIRLYWYIGSASFNCYCMCQGEKLPILENSVIECNVSENLCFHLPLWANKSKIMA